MRRTCSILRDGNGARSKPRRRARRAGGFGDPSRRASAVGERVAPMALARRTLPVLGPLAPLFPEGALRREASSASGARAPRRLRWPSPQVRRPRAWTAVVGDPDLGLAAVGELGVALERLLIVRPEPGNWSSALAALVGAVDVVIAARHRISDTDARRMAARLRERGSVLIHIGDRWPVGADVQLDIAAGEWEGLGDGHGVLRSRRLDIQGGGRGSASRPRQLSPRAWARRGGSRTRRVGRRSAPSSPGVPTGPSSPPVSISPSRWRSCTPTASWRPRPVLGPRGSPGGCGAVPPRVGAPRLSFTNVTRPVKLDCSSRSSLHSTTSPHGSKSPGPACALAMRGHRAISARRRRRRSRPRTPRRGRRRTHRRSGRCGRRPLRRRARRRAADPTRLVPSGEVAGFSLR